MPLAESCCAVSVLFQHLGHRRRILRPIRVISRISRGHIRNGSKADLMAISARKQRGTRGRADRIHLKLVVAKSLFRQSVKVGRGNHATKGRCRTEADIVDQNQDNVRCARRRAWALGPLRCGNAWPRCASRLRPQKHDRLTFVQLERKNRGNRAAAIIDAPDCKNWRRSIFPPIVVSLDTVLICSTFAPALPTNDQKYALRDSCNSRCVLLVELTTPNEGVPNASPGAP